MTTNFFSRRTLLRGAGVALALPWMESLLPKSAIAAGTTAPVRYMPIFFLTGLLFAAVCIPATICVSILERRLGRHAA